MIFSPHFFPPSLLVLLYYSVFQYVRMSDRLCWSPFCPCFIVVSLPSSSFFLFYSCGVLTNDPIVIVEYYFDRDHSIVSYTAFPTVSADISFV